MLIFEYQEKTDYAKLYKRGRFMHRLRITVCTTSSLIILLLKSTRFITRIQFLCNKCYLTGQSYRKVNHIIYFSFIYFYYLIKCVKMSNKNNIINKGSVGFKYVKMIFSSNKLYMDLLHIN